MGSIPGWVRSILQGIGLGVAIILPGLSGGTAALIMGIYDELVHDFSQFRWRPYLPLVAGVVVGLLGGAQATAWLMAAAPDLLKAFLLGVILASAWLVFRRHDRPGPVALAAWFIGIGTALAIARETLGDGGGVVAASLGRVFLGGVVASAAMMLPGMSGGTILIMMGLYDDMLAALNSFYLPMLAVFIGGAAIGMFVVARLVSALLARYPVVTGLFLGGMILGSAKAVLPDGLGVGEGLLILAGAAAVLVWRDPEA